MKEKSHRYRITVTYGTKPGLHFAERLKSKPEAEKLRQLANQLGYSDASIEKYDVSEDVSRTSQKNGANHG